MILTIVSCVVTCVLCYGIYCIVIWHMRRRRLYELASRFEGPPCLPLIGNGHMFFGNTENILNQVTKMSTEYTSPVRFWMGPILFLIITDPEQIQAICHNSKTMGRGWTFERFGEGLLGTGLLTAPVSIWRSHRKMIQPTFNTKILRPYVEIIASQSNILVEQWERYVDGPEFEIFKSLSLCTLDIICETLIDVKVGAQGCGFSKYLEAIEALTGIVIERLFKFWLWPTSIFNLSKLGKDYLKYTRYLKNFNSTLISSERSTIESSTQADAEFYSDSKPKSKTETFFDHLVKLTGDHGKLSDEELRDEVLTMIVAGNDTSAETISMIALMLASHPDIQVKAYRELEEIYGDADVNERPVAYADLSRMEYLERVIKETLRLFPIVGYITREVEEELDIGGHILPAGTLLLISLISVHRNEKYWPDPLKFDPNRFLPEETAKRPSHAFLAFSGGPRNCIGVNFAMMSMKVLLATVLRRYVFKKDNIIPQKDMRFKLDLFVKLVDPIMVRIERRHRN